MATPIVEEAVKSVGKELLPSGIAYVSDVKSGKDFTKSLKSRAKEAWRKCLMAHVRRLTCLVSGKTTSLPIKRKRPERPTLLAKRPHKHQHHERDIFDWTEVWLWYKKKVHNVQNLSLICLLCHQLSYTSIEMLLLNTDQQYLYLEMDQLSFKLMEVVILQTCLKHICT